MALGSLCNVRFRGGGGSGGLAGLASGDSCSPALSAAEGPARAGASGREACSAPAGGEPALLPARVRQSLSLQPENERRHCDSLHVSFRRRNICLLKGHR